MNFELLTILTDYANDPCVVPFQNCVRQRRPVSKMAAMTKNRNFFIWPKLLYFKPESARI
jgi:hypothetical protein